MHKARVFIALSAMYEMACNLPQSWDAPVRITSEYQSGMYAQLRASCKLLIVHLNCVQCALLLYPMSGHLLCCYVRRSYTSVAAVSTKAVVMNVSLHWSRSRSLNHSCSNHLLNNDPIIDDAITGSNRSPSGEVAGLSWSRRRSSGWRRGSR